MHHDQEEEEIWLVNVSSEVTASIKDKSIEVDVTDQAADGREQRK